MTSPRNTSKPDFVDAVDILFGGGIEGQEKAGQQQLLESTTLPTEMHGGDEKFKALGFTFGAVVDGDPLFREATLPEGWKRQGTEHSMWSEIVDQRGIPRVAIFYKAAFYDRGAHMHVTNVGAELASKFVYGEGAQPEVHPELTDEELAEARARAEEYVIKGTERPDYYGDLMARAKQLLEALDTRAQAGAAK